jgi:hypothetical protein
MDHVASSPASALKVEFIIQYKIKHFFTVTMQAVYKNCSSL